MPAHHDVRPKDVMLRRLHGALAAAADRGPTDFADLLLVPGVGARTVQSLAHGRRGGARRAAPLRRSGALLARAWRQGPPSLPGADQGLDETIGVLKSALGSAKLGNDEKLDAIRRLDSQARQLEAHATGPSFGAFTAEERRRSFEYGGRSVFGWEPPPAAIVGRKSS